MSEYEDAILAERSLHQPECGWEPLMNEYMKILWRQRGCICERLERRAVRAVREWVDSGLGADQWMTAGQVRDHATQVAADAEQRGYLLGQQAAYRALSGRGCGVGPNSSRPDVDASPADPADGEAGE